MTTDHHEDVSTQHWPVEIRLKKAEKRLEIDFDDGRSSAIRRSCCGSKARPPRCMGHGPGQKTIVAGRRHVGIMGLEPVGNYAVRIKFDDMHDTGIFSWSYLYELGCNQDEVWAEYLKALEERGLSRDPKPRH